MIMDFWTWLLNELIQIVLLPIYFMFLAVDGIVYSLVAYSYKLFELMTRVNLSSLLYWFNDITDRFNSLIIVVVMFVIGYALINYLIDPNKMINSEMSGVSLLKRIAFTAILLISYQTAFELLHESTFLVIGAPQNYEYHYLKDWFGVTNDGDPGLLSNVIFGKSTEQEEKSDFGTVLAIKAINTFLHNRKGVSSSTLNKVYNRAMKGSEFNLLGLTAVALAFEISFIDDEGKVVYQFPILSTAVGIYLIYTLVKITLAIGVRAFKLALLEFLAPIAIVSIIIGGFKANIWTKWYKLVLKTFTDVFLRIGSVYIVVAFISSISSNTEITGANMAATASNMTFTDGLLMIILIIAGFKFAKELPKIIDEIFGSHLAEANKKGFKDFLSSTVGGIAGGVAGVAGGLSAAKANDLSKGATAWNAVKSGFSGASNGAKSKNISEAVKNATSTTQNARKSAETMRERGGTLRSNAGFAWREKTGQNYAGLRQLDKDVKAEDARVKDAKETAKETHRERQEASRARATAATTAYQEKKQATMRATKEAGEEYSTAVSAQEEIKTRAKAKYDATVSGDGTTKGTAQLKSEAKVQYTADLSEADAAIGSARTTIKTRTSDIETRNAQIEALDERISTHEYKDEVDSSGAVIRTAQQQIDSDKQAEISLRREVEAMQTEIDTATRTITEKEEAKVRIQREYDTTIATIDNTEVQARTEFERVVKDSDAELAKAKRTHDTKIEAIRSQEERERADFDTEMRGIQEEERRENQEYSDTIEEIEEQHNIRVTGRNRHGEKETPVITTVDEDGNTVQRTVKSFDEQRKFYGGKKD